MLHIARVFLFLSLVTTALQLESPPPSAHPNDEDAKVNAAHDERQVLDDAQPVIAIWWHGGRQLRGPGSLLLVVLSDGTVIFADSKQPGGEGLRVGRLDEAAIDSCIMELRTIGFFQFPKDQRTYAGPDSEVMSLFGRDGRIAAVLTSWHERWTNDDSVVVTSRGVISLRGRAKEEFLDARDSDYARFRRIWDNAKTRMLALTPEESEPFHGDWRAVHERVGQLLRAHAGQASASKESARHSTSDR